MKLNGKKNLAFFILLVTLLVFASGCVNQEQPKPLEVKEITKDGITYEFTNNILDSMNISINNATEIKRIVKYAAAVSIVFNSTTEEDNSYFTVINYNMVGKLTHYYAYSRRKYVDETFYNIYTIKGDKLLKFDRSINNWTESPVGIDNIEWPVLYMKGPNTGASETSVSLDLDGRIVYIQGTNYRNLSLAADRFVLEVLDVNIDLLNEGKRDFS